MATLVFLTTFSVQRINAHKAEQAVAASAFISQLTVLAENTREQTLDELVDPFLGTLVGVNIFNCVSLSIEALNKAYDWPYPNCQDLKEGDTAGLQVTSHRSDWPSAEIRIHAILDDGNPIEKFAAEAGQIAVSALIMGLIGLLAVNLAFNKAVRRPLTNLLDQLHLVLSRSGEEHFRDDENHIGSSPTSSRYESLLERAKELKRKEAFWRAVTDSSFDCVICADSGGRIIDFNAAAEKTFGYPRDSITGFPITNLINLDEFRTALKLEWPDYLDAKKLQGTDGTVQTAAFHADGTELLVELSIADIELEGERFFTAYLRDITEENKILKALEESETMLIQSAEVAELGYAIWDDTLDRDVMVTEELARIHGFARDEYLETVSSMDAYLDLVIPDDRERYLEYENRFAQEASFLGADVEYRVVRPDGEIRYLHQRAQYLPAPGGRPTRSIVVIQDVTEQRQVEAGLLESQQALAQSEAMLTQSAAMANLAHAIWDHSEESLLQVSDNWACTYGYTHREFTEKFTKLGNEVELVHPEDRERFYAWVTDYGSVGEVPDIEYRIVRRDGKIRHLLERSKRITGHTDEKTRSLITIQDITDRIEHENELDEARKSAEQASVAKSSFLAMMSHEIRTPLNAVLGALGLLDVKELDPSLRKFLDTGRKGAESLLLIVNDVLDFSKIEAGKLPLEPALFSLQKTINDVQQVLEPRVSKKGIWLTGDVGPDVPEYLIGDASRIRQVLLNLCSNAVRFTRRGGVHISISQSGVEDKVALVRFQVEDSGRGVPLENQKHLFEEFWGTNDTVSDKTGGTGLGLPISKRLVEMMEGDIGFESVPQCGSVFWFELPLEIPDEQTINAEKNKPRKFDQIAPYENLPALQGRVLLAEDNPANQLIAQVMLERFGLQVDVAANGHEAIGMLRSAPYDLVLMDINMPEMGGDEATVIIRKLPGALSRMPIIAMTALAMPGDRENFLSMGMDGYISKPIIREELHACITRVLEGHEPAAFNANDRNEIDTDPLVIDVKVLKTLEQEVGAEYLPDIIDSYLSEAPALVDEITTAVALGDCEPVTRGAHPLKSSSANLGAMVLSELARKLELAGREHDLEKIRQEVVPLSDLFEQTREELQRARRELDLAD
jgi:PAS domain S-box-containing protein